MSSNFFANQGRSTPRGRGLSYKMGGQSALFKFFALNPFFRNRYFAIAKNLNNADLAQIL
jgi:hypothetical protein